MKKHTFKQKNMATGADNFESKIKPCFAKCEK